MATLPESDLHWGCYPFESLTLDQLYLVLKLRSTVFVVEQECVYQDLDGLDQQAWHVLGIGDMGLVCYARLLPPGCKYQEPAIGRVISAPAVRGTGLGRLLVQQAVAHCHELWPLQGIRISAQQHLEQFYCDLGFATVSAPYLEDGIPHVEMLQA